MPNNVAKTKSSYLDNGLRNLFVEVSNQRECITADELRKKRLLAHVTQQHQNLKTVPSPILDSAPKREQFSARWAKPMLAAGLLLCAAAAFYMGLVQNGNPQPKTAEVVAPVDPSHEGNAPTTQTNAHINVIERTQHSTQLPEFTRESLSAGIEMAVGANTHYSVNSNTGKAVNIRLLSGTLWISKDSRFSAMPLEVATPHGTVTVVGTSLSVHGNRSTTIVKVLDGVVRISDAANISHVLNSGNMLTMHLDMTQTQSIPNIEGETARFIKMGLRVTHPVSPTSRSKGSQKTNTVKESGSAKPHLISRSDAQLAVASETNGMTIDNLFTQIEGHRSRKEWQAAADAYLKLIKQYGSANESQSAKLAVANLFLGKLHRPLVSLTWYERYLEGTSKPLLPEALFGKSRALRALNQPVKEKEILKIIVQKFPKSLYGVKASQRLLQLEH